MEKWNKIVDLYYQNRLESEDKIQHLWEKILAEFFGWSSLIGEIDSQRILQIGSNQRTIPDIIIRKDKTDLFIFELKRGNSLLEEKTKAQLFSYMKLTQIEFGVIICDKIHVFQYNPVINDKMIEVSTIDFSKNNQEGLLFINTFSKNDYSKERVTNYIENELSARSAIEKLKKELNEEFVNLSIREQLRKTYNEDVIERALKNTIFKLITIEANEKIKPKPDPLIIPSVDIDKSKSISLFKEYGVIFESKNITYATLQKKYNWFWANPNVDYLAKLWYLILNDNKKRKLYLLKIPAYSLNVSSNSGTNTLLRRNDKPYQIDLNIIDEIFIDKSSKVDFKKYQYKVINY